MAGLPYAPAHSTTRVARTVERTPSLIVTTPVTTPCSMIDEIG